MSKYIIQNVVINIEIYYLFIIQMFYAEDYELHVLCKGQCPFCRQAPTSN